jgi:hypothetical protein
MIGLTTPFRRIRHEGLLEYGLIDAGSVRAALIADNESLRVDEVLVLVCARDERGVDEAKYCLAKHCSEVLNAKEVCTAARRLTGE